jgi:hypothetical protein
MLLSPKGERNMKGEDHGKDEADESDARDHFAGEFAPTQMSSGYW